MRWRRQLPAVLLSLLFVAPVALLLLGSLRAPGQPPPAAFEVVPSRPGTEAYGDAFALVDLGRQLLNSAIVAALAVPLTVLTASWAGFAIAMLARRAKRIAVALSLVLLMVPVSALWVPRFVMFREAGLVDTWAPLVAPALMGTTPFFVLLFAWSFSRLPHDLLDAARVEGLGPWRTWRRVAAPLVRPATFAVAALAFVVHWGNFVDPLIYLSDPDLYTAPLGLRELLALGRADLSVLLAGAAVVALPPVLAFWLAQRRFLGDPVAQR